jgi:glutamate N-acetyltransferase/amino-acid N-acetyltransferase
MPTLPQGFRAGGIYSGVKRNPDKLDLSLVFSDRPAVGVGVYTQNLVSAAPVNFDRSRTPSDRIRCIAINSGVANACTGEQGDRDAAQMAAWAAEACGARADEALVMSTGVIGEMLPLDKIRIGLPKLAAELGTDEKSLERAARGMMTTDTVPKIRGRVVKIGDQTITVTGIAKGAAMIGPNMSTMLALVMTDAALAKEDAQAALFDAVDESFNCISVDGHMSTNDTVLLVANGAAAERAGSRAPSRSDGRTPDSSDRLQLTGRTNCDRIVVFDGNRRQVGRFLPVIVYDANAHTLFGEMVTQHVGPEVFGLSLPLAEAAGQNR